MCAECYEKVQDECLPNRAGLNQGHFPEEVKQTEAKRMRTEGKSHSSREQSRYRCYGEEFRYYSKCKGKAVGGSTLGKGLSPAAGCDRMRRGHELIGSPHGSRQEKKAYLDQGLLSNASAPQRGPSFCPCALC